MTLLEMILLQSLGNSFWYMVWLWSSRNDFISWLRGSLLT